MKRSLEFKDENSAKFWEIEVAGSLAGVHHLRCSDIDHGKRHLRVGHLSSRSVENAVLSTDFSTPKFCYRAGQNDFPARRALRLA